MKHTKFIPLFALTCLTPVFSQTPGEQSPSFLDSLSMMHWLGILAVALAVIGGIAWWYTNRDK